MSARDSVKVRRFLWDAIRIYSHKENEAFALQRATSMSDLLAQGKTTKEALAQHGELHYAESLVASWAVGAFLAGLTGNLLAGAMGHFADHPGTGLWAQENRAWTLLGLLALLLLIWLPLWAHGLFERYRLIGRAYAAAAGAKVI